MKISIRFCTGWNHEHESWLHGVRDHQMEFLPVVSGGRDLMTSLDNIKASLEHNKLVCKRTSRKLILDMRMQATNVDIRMPAVTCRA